MMEAKGMELLGWTGGLFIALSLLPQVVKTYKSKSAGDISYVYQAIYIAGCSLVNSYAIFYGLWPVYVPCLIEESLIIVLTMMKYVYDKKEMQSILDSGLALRELKGRSRRSIMMMVARSEANMMVESEAKLMVESNAASTDVNPDDEWEAAERFDIETGRSAQVTRRNTSFM